MKANHELDCTKAQAQLPLYVGGDLDEDVQAGVTAHLAGCEACCQEWRRAVSARQALLGLRGRVTGEGVDLWSGVRAELLADGRIGAAPLTAPVRSAAPRALSAWPVWAAAACLVGLLVAGRSWTPAAGVPPSGSTARELAAETDSTAAPRYPGAVKLIPTFVAGDERSSQAPTFGLDSESGRTRLRRLLPGEQALGERAVWYSTQPVRLGGGPLSATPVSGSGHQ